MSCGQESGEIDPEMSHCHAARLKTLIIMWSTIAVLGEGVAPSRVGDRGVSHDIMKKYGCMEVRVELMFVGVFMSRCLVDL